MRAESHQRVGFDFYSFPMALNQLKRRIGAALTQSSGRETLLTILRDLGSSQAAPDGPLFSTSGRDMHQDRPYVVPAAAPPGSSTTSSWVMLPALTSEEIASTSVSLQTMLNTVNDAIVAIDSAGTVLSANASARRLFNDPLLGYSIGAFFPSLPLAEGALEALAAQYDSADGLPELIDARSAGGCCFTAELTISRMEQESETCFILCARDVSERLHNLQALRDSEARYRVLVENAPEAILVLDADENRFIDANENAAHLFKMSREELLSMGVVEISPEHQLDGLPSFGAQRGYIERAMRGGRPVFEWLYLDANGREIPCEVRFIRLPSSKRRLIRASVIDVVARRRADTLAYGERKLLELIVANAPLDRILRATVRIAEQMHDDAQVALMEYDQAAEQLELRACGRVVGEFRDALRLVPIGPDAGPCAAAISLGRQVVVSDMATDEMCAGIARVALDNSVRAACSTPIITTAGRIQGTLAFYFTRARGPTIEELDLISRLTQIVGIAIKRKQDEAALRDSEARFRGLFDNVVDGVFQMTLDGHLLSANPALVRMLGFQTRQELGDASLADFCADPKDHERLIKELTAYGRVRNYEYRLRRLSGTMIVVVQNSRMVKDVAGNALYCEGTVTDVTQRKAAERALFEEKERAEVTLKSIGDAVVTTDAGGKVVYLNPVAEQLTGWERRVARGRPVQEVIQLKDDVKGEIVESPVLRCLREGRLATLTEHSVLVSRDGTEVAIQDSAAPIRDHDGKVVGAVLVFHDVSRERQLHRKLSYYASHDSLTGLINRREFEERLSSVLRAVKQGNEREYALLYMDLDQFKIVNDTCGHAAGDLLLRQLADLLQSRVRASDVVARLGGDEFAVLLSDCTIEKATELADLLREAVAGFRFNWEDGSLQVGVSIGIVPLSAESENIGSLFSAADVACYVAKDMGRNRVHAYEEGDAAARHEEMQWVSRISRARDEERFELYFQPIVPIGRTERTSAQFELLLRMRDEHGELIPPDTFIPAAERYNLMPALDRWVINEVLESLIYRPDMNCEPYTLAVNVSGTTLNDPRFLDYVCNELAEAQIADGALCFEITETAAISNLERTVQFMHALKALGCRFSLDDFGTGLSSLTYLKNLPVDYVKIDGQFIQNVMKDAADESVVEAIAKMASAFQIRTIAERVESKEVLARLAEIGISYAQGFFVAVPQPVSELPIRAIPRQLQA